MKSPQLLLAGVILAILWQVGCANPPAEKDTQVLPVVLIQTILGNISVEIDSVAAPITAANFLRYVDEKLYDGGAFFRTVHAGNQPQDSIRIEVIQGGANREMRDQGFPSIELERTNVTMLKHLDGAISMARGGPDTATDSFFFCIGDQPDLDFGGLRNPDGQGFAVFGNVLKGGDVIRTIQRSTHENQSLDPPIEIVSVRRQE